MDILIALATDRSYDKEGRLQRDLCARQVGPAVLEALPRGRGKSDRDGGGVGLQAEALLEAVCTREPTALDSGVRSGIALAYELQRTVQAEPHLQGYHAQASARVSMLRPIYKLLR